MESRSVLSIICLFVSEIRPMEGDGLAELLGNITASNMHSPNHEDVNMRYNTTQDPSDIARTHFTKDDVCF
jgi:hypothetical protein